MIIRAVDMLTNLKNWPAWDYKGYKINEDESKPIIKALDNYIWHDVELEGFPKEPGFYLFKSKVNEDELMDKYLTGVILDSTGVINFNGNDMDNIISWRKIVDEGDE